MTNHIFGRRSPKDASEIKRIITFEQKWKFKTLQGKCIFDWQSHVFFAEDSNPDTMTLNTLYSNFTSRCDVSVTKDTIVQAWANPQRYNNWIIRNIRASTNRVPNCYLHNTDVENVPFVYHSNRSKQNQSFEDGQRSIEILQSRNTMHVFDILLMLSIVHAACSSKCWNIICTVCCANNASNAKEQRDVRGLYALFNVNEGFRLPIFLHWFWHIWAMSVFSHTLMRADFVFKIKIIRY